jgi:hypothetical protein
MSVGSKVVVQCENYLFLLGQDVHKRLRHFFLLVTWALLLNLGLYGGTFCIVRAIPLLGFCVCVGSRPDKHPLEW